jgi:hypothetical protein
MTIQCKLQLVLQCGQVPENIISKLHNNTDYTTNLSWHYARFGFSTVVFTLVEGGCIHCYKSLGSV